MDKEVLGKQIRSARKDRGLTTEKLSELLDVTPTYVRQLESGAASPSINRFINICNILNVSPNYLLQGNLENNELTGCIELMELWKKASPSHTELITAMLHTALDKLAE